MCLDDIAAVGKYLNSMLSVPSTDRSPAHLRVEFEHLLLVCLCIGGPGVVCIGGAGSCLHWGAGSCLHWGAGSCLQ